jgi:hypothetical protein
MLVRLRDAYVLADDDVKLDVTVGEGQKAFLEVLLNGRPIGHGADVKDLAVGKGSELAGSRLRITATVTDTNTDTNRTSVTYRLTGGRSTMVRTSEHTVDIDGDTVDYDAIFLLL